MSYTRLFSPIRIGNLELANRIIFPAITTYYDTHYDLQGEARSTDFFAEIARGGAGLIVLAGLQALYPGRRDPPRVAVNDDKWLPYLKGWADAIHEGGANVAAQLAVWTYWSPGGAGGPAEDISPSGVVTWAPEASARYKFNTASRALTVREIHRIEQEVAVAAYRAREAGCDAVELPAVAGNLLNRFITPYTNRREDEYGGSLENRLRFWVETVAAIRAAAGADLPLIARVSVDDRMPWGMTLPDALEYVPLVVASGVDAISVFVGWYESETPKYPMRVPRGAFVDLAAAIKKVVDLPVCANIRISDPVMAEEILARGQADMVAIGRGLIADPEWPRKASAGRDREIRFCTACCACFDDIITKAPLRCSVNARVGNEAATVITPALKSRHVWVIGGGPAGMEAARVAAMRGHRVTLFEAAPKLGGQLAVAAAPPDKAEWRTLLDYLSEQLSQLGVENKTGVTATAQMVAEASPEAVVLASGVVPWLPTVPGLDAADALLAVQVLTGAPVPGDSVTVVGGGLIGCETAEYLAELGKTVTVLEMQSEAGADIGLFNRPVVLRALAALGVNIITDAKVVAVGAGTITLETPEGRREMAVETLVWATGTVPYHPLAAELAGLTTELIQIGDCVDPRGRVKQAIADGFSAGNRL